MRPPRDSHGLILFCMIAVIIASGLPTISLAEDQQLGRESVNWRLTDGRVVYPGDRLIIDRSTLMTGYVLEAAAASSNGPVKKGLFRATLTAFSPTERRDGQNPDLWYP